MTATHLYTDFGQATQDTATTVNAASPDDIEEEKLEAFENGYRSGWDDAIAAQDSMRARATEALARALEQARLTRHDVRIAVLDDIRSALEPLLETLLPQLSREALLPHLLEQIDSLAQQHSENRIELTVSPERMVFMQELLSDDAHEIVVRPDEDLTGDQVFIGLANSERELNIAPYVEEILDNVRHHFATARTAQGDTE